MPPTDDQRPLRGVARSLDDLFSRVAEPPPPPPASPPVHADVLDAVELAEGPLLDADVLVDEIAGPVELLPEVDHAEERRVRIAAAGDSLAEAVDALVSGGDPGLLQRVRDEVATLREERTLDPIADAVERLARLTPAGEPDHAEDELARQIATPAVAAVLARRLAGAREDGRRQELTDACRRLGEEAAVALSSALTTSTDMSERHNLVAGLVAMGDHGL